MIILSLDIKPFTLDIMTIQIKIKPDFLGVIIISKRYLNYCQVFLLEFAVKFLRHSNSDYVIKLKKIKNHFMALPKAWIE